MLYPLVADTRIQAEVGANLRGCHSTDALGNLAVRVVEVSKQDGMVAASCTGLRACSRLLPLVDTMHAQRAAFDRAFAARHVGKLVSQGLMHERPCLVRAGHHAIAAADAEKLG